MPWDELVKLSLLGTERSHLSDEIKTTLSNYGIDVEKEITEVVLEGAALLAPLQKAGFEPKTWEGDIITPSLEESLTPCNEKSVAHLSLILNGSYPNALIEFIEAMAINKKCLPPELLPELFDKCVKDESLWGALQSSIGNRGKWLLSLNPAWQSLNIAPQLEDWEIGSQKERLILLKNLRKANPAAGLELLLSTWAEDGLSAKKAFLKCLEIGLSDTDEAFLETCLDFSRKEIREIAAKLLGSLPNSRLQKRIYTQLQKAINLSTKEDGRLTLKLLLPKTNDTLLIRDGINPKKKWKNGGLATGMLYQMIALLPPQHWEIHLGKTPTQILALSSENEWGNMLVEGFAAAAALHQSADWMEAIVQFWLTNYGKRKWSQLNVKPILEHLPNELFNDLLFKKLKATQFLPEEHSPLIQLLQKEQYYWHRPLTLLVMQQLREWIGKNTTYSWTGFQYRVMLKNAAYAISTKMERELSEFWLSDAPAWAGWGKDLQQFLTILSFRKEMLEALQK
jgi:hypothetical protein